MIEIKITHEITLSDKTESLLTNLIALASGAGSNKQNIVALTTATEPKKESTAKVETEAETKKAPEPNVATKIRYFQHEGTEDLVVVKKGESLDFLETDSFDELSAAEYKRKLAEQEAANEPVEEDEDSKDESEEIPTIEDMRYFAAKLGGEGKQADVKKVLVHFGAKKISEIPEESRSEAIEMFKEKIEEYGIK